MGKVSKFGIFSPAVVGAKIALGESRLNKIRGKVRPQTARFERRAPYMTHDASRPTVRTQAVPNCRAESRA